MAFYEANLAVLVLFSTILLFRQYRVDAKKAILEIEEGLKEPSNLGQDAIKRFKRAFFPAYCFVYAADWLQGPHIYALYKYEKKLPETTVAALYAAGFIGSAISASFVGHAADRYGRRAACLLYCVAYSLCCLTMLSNNLPVLFMGRLSGGLSTTLLYSVFETWMIAEYHDQALDAYSLSLGNMFGKMTTLSSIVAIVSGVSGDALVQHTGAKTSPFLASVVCLCIACVWISRYWNENYGDSARQSGKTRSGSVGLWSILRDKRIMSLGMASCCFEGSMYLFVFFWSSAIQSVRTSSKVNVAIPFGVIFSCYMCAMMSGSILFTLATPSHDLKSATYTLMCVLTGASVCLLSTILLRNEVLVFWSFCLFEAFVGAYFPSMAFLKGSVVDDGMRGKVYGMSRLPLSIFVVVAHSLAEEGDHHRNNVFLTCGSMLLVAFLVVQRYMSA